MVAGSLLFFFEIVFTHRHAVDTTSGDENQPRTRETGQMTRLEEAKIELTLKFIAGRRPTNKEMIEVEKLREEISELEYEQRRDISWCKS